MTGLDVFRVFLSAVSSECGEARSLIASDLRSRGIEVRVQEDFRQEVDADTALAKVHDYIRSCSAVVCLVGKRTGAMPPPAAAHPYGHMLPDGVTEASYTQWELLFARYYKKRLSIYHAGADYEPDLPEPIGDDNPELQARFVYWLFEVLGLDRSGFANRDEAGRLVLREDWPRSGPPQEQPGMRRRLDLRRIGDRSAPILGRLLQEVAAAGRLPLKDVGTHLYVVVEDVDSHSPGPTLLRAGRSRESVAPPNVPNSRFSFGEGIVGWAAANASGLVVDLPGRRFRRTGTLDWMPLADGPVEPPTLERLDDFRLVMAELVVDRDDVIGVLSLNIDVASPGAIDESATQDMEQSLRRAAFAASSAITREDDLVTLAPVHAWTDDGQSFIPLLSVSNAGEAGVFNAKVMTAVFPSADGTSIVADIPKEPWFMRWHGHPGPNREIRKGDVAFLEVGVAVFQPPRFEFLTPEGKLKGVVVAFGAGNDWHMQVRLWKDDTEPRDWWIRVRVDDTMYPILAIVDELPPALLEE